MEIVIDMFKNLNLPQQKAIKQEFISMEFKAEKFLIYFTNRNDQMPRMF